MTLAPLLDPPGGPLLLVSDFCYRRVWWLRVRPVWAALPGAARALSSFPFPYLPLLSSHALVLYCMYCTGGGLGRGGCLGQPRALRCSRKIMLCYVMSFNSNVERYPSAYAVHV